MKLERAIEVNEDNVEFLESGGFQECADAVKLGNEALKRVKSQRPPGSYALGHHLPGETED